MRAFLALVFVVAAGCSYSSGIMKLGPDTYSASASVWSIRGGYPEARRQVIAEANEHCSQLGKEILVTNVNQVGGSGRTYAAEIIFRCISKEGSELQRSPQGR